MKNFKHALLMTLAITVISIPGCDPVYVPYFDIYAYDYRVIGLNRQLRLPSSGRGVHGAFLRDTAYNSKPGRITSFNIQVGQDGTARIVDARVPADWQFSVSRRPLL